MAVAHKVNLDAARTGTNAWNHHASTQREHSGIRWRADLRKADLAGVDLEGAELADANLWRADLSGAHLRSADLEGSDLERADLRNADLRGAVLTRANLRGAKLAGARLEGAKLLGADLAGAELTGSIADDSTVWPSGHSTEDDDGSADTITVLPLERRTFLSDDQQALTNHGLEAFLALVRPYREPGGAADRDLMLQIDSDSRSLEAQLRSPRPNTAIVANGMAAILEAIAPMLDSADFGAARDVLQQTAHIGRRPTEDGSHAESALGQALNNPPAETEEQPDGPELTDRLAKAGKATVEIAKGVESVDKAIAILQRWAAVHGDAREFVWPIVQMLLGLFGAA